MTLTGARESGIERAGKWGDLRPVNPDNSPNNPLRREGCCAVAEGQGPVEEDLAPPADGEEDAGDWVEGKPAIPASEVNFKNLAHV